jgi:hypothetical protein
MRGNSIMKKKNISAHLASWEREGLSVTAVLSEHTLAGVCIEVVTVSASRCFITLAPDSWDYAAEKQL